MKTLIKILLAVLFCIGVGFTQWVHQDGKWWLADGYRYPNLQITKTSSKVGYQEFDNVGTTSMYGGENQLQMIWQIYLPSYPEILDSVNVNLQVLGEKNLISAAIGLEIQDSSMFFFSGYYAYFNISEKGTQEVTIPLGTELKSIGTKMNNIMIFTLVFILASQDSCDVDLDVALYKITGEDSLKTRNITYFDASVTGIAKKQQIPKGFVLEQNYPNPFNSSTRIQFTCSKQEQVKLIVFNSLGQVVATLVDEKKNTGSYSVTFDGNNLPSGVYFYTISIGDQMITKKMIFLK